MPQSNIAMLRVTLGRHVALRAKVQVTPVGLLAIGGLVSSVLLSTSVLVGVATRHTPDRH